MYMYGKSLTKLTVKRSKHLDACVTKQNLHVSCYHIHCTYIFTCFTGLRFSTFLAFTICITILTLF